MANVKISQLPTASAVTSDDFLPIVDSGSTTTQQASFQQVLDYVTGSTFNELVFDTTHVATGHTTGRFSWNATDATLDLNMSGSDVTLQLGQEQHIYVKNQSGVDINNGEAVRIVGSTGTNITIEKAIARLSDLSAPDETNGIVGVATENIANNNFGYITTYGLVRDFDTVGSGSEGSILYLSNTVSGAYTSIRPNAPYEVVEVGVLVVSGPSNGEVFVQPREPILFSDVTPFSTASIPAAQKSYFCYDDTTKIVSLSNQITASVVSASNFYGDGSGITGVTGEWDGTHTGNAEITGTLSVENGNINITQNAYFLQGTATGGSNVSLIGVSSGDEIEIGNQGYTNRVVDDLVVSGTLIGSVALSGAVGSEIQVSSYSLSADDRGKTLIFSSSATQGITCSSGLDVGFNTTFVQYGSGQLELSASSGVTILNRQSHTKTAGTYAAASVVIISSDVYLFSGDTSA